MSKQDSFDFTTALPIINEDTEFFSPNVATG